MSITSTIGISKAEALLKLKYKMMSEQEDLIDLAILNMRNYQIESAISCEMYDFVIEDVDMSAQDVIDDLQEQLESYKSGFKGACPTCEIVGEKNGELVWENIALKSKIRSKCG